MMEHATELRRTIESALQSASVDFDALAEQLSWIMGYEIYQIQHTFVPCIREARAVWPQTNTLVRNKVLARICLESDMRKKLEA